MLPILKKYSDAIRSAHLNLIEKSPKTLTEALYKEVERTFCDKLINELEHLNPKPTPKPTSEVKPSTGTSDISTTVESVESVKSVKSVESVESVKSVTATQLLNVVPIPALEYLQKLDITNSVIIDEMIALDRETPTKLHYVDRVAVYFERVRGTPSSLPATEYIVWLLERGFYPDLTTNTLTLTSLDVFKALQKVDKANTSFRADLPLSLATYRMWEKFMWVLENVRSQWSARDQWSERDVLWVVLKAHKEGTIQNTEAVIKCLFKNMLLA